MANAQDIQSWFHQQTVEKATQIVGGWSRLKVIGLMAGVLALDSADKTAVGAIAGQLKHALNIGNMEVGLLVTVSTGIGALATLPMGILADRVHRVKLLVASIILWSIAMIVSGFSNSYIMLLLTRLALGAVVATAFPVISSLTGDYFQPAERGCIWGYILSGELFGAGFGILIAGEAAALLSWRFSFWVLAIISIVVAAAIWKWLPEPARGGQSHLQHGKREIPTTEELEEQKDHQSKEQRNDAADEEDEVEEEIEEKDITPIEPLVLEEDPKDMPFWPAVRYILSIRTNVLLIIASAFGYFFFTGVRTFAVVFVRGRFDLSASVGKLLLIVIGLGSILGVLITGRVADRLIGRGNIRARITIPAVAFFITAALFLAGFYMTSMYIAVPLLFLAAAGLGGTNAPLDAARLDIMHFRLWGRAESVRTTLRYSFEAVAPIVFGWVSNLFGAQSGLFGGGIQEGGAVLAQTFKLMLIPVVIAGIVLYFARKPYPEDVATAIMSQKKTRDND
jgi:MFS family permease